MTTVRTSAPASRLCNTNHGDSLCGWYLCSSDSQVLSVGMEKNWLVAQDAGTGLPIYFNQLTQQSQWEEPLELRMPEGWEMGFLEGRQFFANRETGESVWERPLLSALEKPVWEESVDADGRVFYFNTATQESSWEPPPGFVSQQRSSVWEVDVDEQGRTFYFNTLTQESQWDPPRELGGSVSPAPSSRSNSRGGDSRRGRRRKRPSSRGSATGSFEETAADWEINIDEEGRTFYFNTRTAQTQWDEPAVLKLPKGWVREVDATGKEYFVNDNTGETTWDRPLTKSKKGQKPKAGAHEDISNLTQREIEALDWEEEKDGSGKPFWVNMKTGDMVMEKPECLVSEEENGEDDANDELEDPSMVGIKEMTDEDWELVRSNSDVIAVWGDWETYKHIGKPCTYDKEEEKKYQQRIKEMKKEEEKVLQNRAKRLEDIKRQREAEDKKAMKLTLKKKRELALRRDKEDKAEELLQIEESNALVPEPAKEYPPFPADGTFWYHMVDDKSVWEDPILEGWTDGSTDGSDSTDAPTADEENDTLVLDGKEHREEGKKEASKDGDLYDDPAKSKGDKESKFEDEGKQFEEQVDEGKARRRIKRRVKRRDRYGDHIAEYRPYPKPPVRRTDRKVNACFQHENRFLNMGRMDMARLPKRILTQTKTVVKHINLEENLLKHITEDECKRLLCPLKKLTVLDLRGNFLKTIPDELGQIRSLTAISLANNQIESLPTGVFLLTGLTALSLCQNKLKHFPQELGVSTMRNHKVWELNIGSWHSLTSLDLSQNLFEDLPTHNPSQQREAQFGDLTALTHLDLSINNFISLPDECSRLSSLTHLDLSENKFEAYPAPLAYLTNLEQLIFNHNRLSKLPEMVGSLNILRILSLKNNNIVDIPDAIGSLVCLNELDLSLNQIKILPKNLQGMRSLIELNLSENALEGLPDGIGGLIALKRLIANKNNITYISPDVKDMISLVHVDLSENKLDPEGFHQGHFFAPLSNLATLKLANNNIDEIPEGWGPGLKKLVELDLSHNVVNKISKDFSECTTLERLDLYGNKVSKLPVRIGKLKNLQFINLGKNLLTHLPDSFIELKSLKGTIDLSENDFDERPEFLWSMEGIHHVILSGNPLRAGGGSYTVHMVRGDTAFGDHLYDEAIKHYTRVLDIDDRNIEAIEKRAKIFHRLGDSQRAIEDITRAIDIKFKDASLYYNRGMLYLHLNENEKAMFDFMQALDRNPELKPAMLGQAEAFNQIGQFDSALKMCSLAFGDLTKFESWQTSDTVKSCLRIAGYAHMRRGRALRAMAFFENLLERGVENVYKIQILVGLAFRDMDNTKDAISTFSEIISHFDENPDELEEEPENKKIYAMAVMNRMAAYGSLNQPKLATRDYEKLHPRQPTTELLEAVEREKAKRARILAEKKAAAKARLEEREKKLAKQIEMMNAKHGKTLDDTRQGKTSEEKVHHHK